MLRKDLFYILAVDLINTDKNSLVKQLILLSMRNLFCVLIALSLISCQKFDEDPKVYYAPNNYILGVEDETMLTTEYATLNITPRGEAADILFSFKGMEVDIASTIAQFDIEVSGIACTRNGRQYSLEGNGIESVMTYTMRYYDDKKEINIKTGQITRSVDVSGLIHQTNPSRSSVSITSTILNKELTLSLQNLTTNKKKAQFGQLGYPSRDGGFINTERRFKNESGHVVTVFYSGLKGWRQSEVTIKPGDTGKYSMIEIMDVPGSFFLLTFDDGKVSKHTKSEKPFDYSGLPLEIADTPFLYFNYGRIYYMDDHVCTYTVTPEIYDNAVAASGN